MRVLFRVDASPTIGTGHAMRCLALAQAVRDAGGDASFVGEVGTAVARRLAAEGIDWHSTRAPAAGADDAHRTLALAEASAADRLVVDGYHFDASYRASLAAEGGPLVAAIDDFAADVVAADCWINGNLFASPTMYDAADPDAEVLAAPRFALLRREFRRAVRPPMRGGPARRIVVTFGGSDPAGLTRIAVAALAGLQPLPEVRILLGADARDNPAAAAARDAGFGVETDVEDMAEPLGWGDLVIGAAGTSALEYAWARIPALVVVVAPNQAAVAGVVEERGLGQDVTAHALAGPDALAPVIDALRHDGTRLSGMSEAAGETVDGRGAELVTASLSEPPLRLRPARAEDEARLLAWSNDPESRTASFRSDLITPEEHATWFRRQLADHDALIFIGEQQGSPVGVVRFAVDGSDTTISVTVDPASRSRGIGWRLIDRGCRRVMLDREVNSIVAHVRPENERSIRAFGQAGFVPGTGSGDDGTPPGSLLFVRRRRSQP